MRGGVSDPGIGEGEPKAAKIPSAAGRTVVLVAPGLVKPVSDAGSISREDRKDLSSRFVFVLVTTRNESIKSFCWEGVDPFKSRTY